MGLKLVEVEEDIAANLPECSSGSQILAVVEGANLLRSRGIWGLIPRQASKFILRSLDDSPLLIAQKEKPIDFPGTKDGEQIAWGEFKKPDKPFVPGSKAVEPLQFIAGSMVRFALGDKAVEITLLDDQQMFLEGDEPSCCKFEVGNPTVQFGLVPDEWIHNTRPIDFS